MHINLKNEKVRNEKLYRVGIDESTGEYILAVCVTWVAWYDRYFLISKEEYDSFGTEELDNLAFACGKGTMGERFIGSENRRDYGEEFPNTIYYHGVYCHEDIYDGKRILILPHKHLNEKEEQAGFKLFDDGDRRFYGMFPDEK